MGDINDWDSPNSRNPEGDSTPPTYQPISDSPPPPYQPAAPQDGWNTVQPPPYQQPQYPQQYGHPQGLQQHPQSVTVLIVGLLGLLLCQLASPFAWYLGDKTRKEIKNNPQLYKDDSMATIGWVLGIIGSAILILCFGLFMLLFAIGLSTS